MPVTQDGSARVTAREAAIGRAVAREAEVQAGAEAGGAGEGDVRPSTGEPSPAPAASPPEPPPVVSPPPKPATPPEVSEAARTLASHRSQMKEEVRREMEAAGEIEPDEGNATKGEEAPETPPAAAPDETPAPAGEEPPTYGPVTVEPGAAPPELPPGLVWVEIPEGSPLRDRGHTHMPATRGSEEYIRSQLNNPIRNKAVEAAERRARDAERAMAEFKARMEALQSDEAKALQDPQIQQLYDDIKEQYGETFAEMFRKGIDAQTSSIQESAAQRARRETETQATVQSFWNDVNNVAPQRYEHWSPMELQRHLQTAIYGTADEPGYADILDAVGRMPSVEEFFTRYIDHQYARDPNVLAAHQRRLDTRSTESEEARKAALEAERARMKQDIREELLAEAAKRAQKRSENPFGQLRQTPASTRTADSESVDHPGPATPGQYKRQMRERAIGRVGGAT